jgi:hypothetical protein
MDFSFSAVDLNPNKRKIIGKRLHGNIFSISLPHSFTLTPSHSPVRVNFPTYVFVIDAENASLTHEF